MEIVVMYPWSDEIAEKADKELLLQVQEWYCEGLVGELDALLILTGKTLSQLLA